MQYICTNLWKFISSPAFPMVIFEVFSALIIALSCLCLWEAFHALLTQKDLVNGHKRLELCDHHCKKHLKLGSLAGGRHQCQELTPTGSPLHLCQCTFEEGREEVRRKH